MTDVRMDRHGNVKVLRSRKGAKAKRRWLDREVDRYRAGLLPLEGLAEAAISELGWKGGPGSGNWGHAGRPGQVGGSAAGSGRVVTCNSDDCLDSWGKDDFTKWKSSLGAAEVGAIEGYTFDSYTPINKFLRSGRKPRDSESRAAVDTIKDLDSALDKSRLKEPVVLHRAMCDKASCLKKYGVLEPGAEFTDKGFVSTTISSTAWTWDSKLTLQILVPAGRKAAYLGDLAEVPEEQEVLLPRNTRFKVVGRQRDGKNVTLRVVVMK